MKFYRPDLPCAKGAKVMPSRSRLTINLVPFGAVLAVDATGGCFQPGGCRRRRGGSSEGRQVGLIGSQGNLGKSGFSIRPEVGLLTSYRPGHIKSAFLFHVLIISGKSIQVLPGSIVRSNPREG